ncbi:MAG: DUF4160 domain-containing protein [Pseudomonadales bacterium]|jgi:hypothetical protein|nr:DUF4160 domain-containing protein [Pseudomonadales bacterium]
MTTRHRFRNKYRLEVREDDHPPMHVHLAGADVDVVISLETLAVTGDAPKTLLSEVLEWVALHQSELIEEWKKWHD